MAFPELNFTPEEWATRLARRLDSEIGVLCELDAYYEGIQELSYMHPVLLEELGDRLRQVVINWPRLVVDSIEERLDVEGFRRDADAEADDTLWYWWQANGMDEQSQQGHVDALTMRRSFITVGAPDDGDDFPRYAVESPLQMWADVDPRTRQVRAALKRWIDSEAGLDGTIGRQYATLYLPDATHWYELDGPGWQEVDRDEHGMGVVPVVPLVNRPRLLEPLGVSELADVIPLSDAACKIATDMMVSAEYHAMPRRWALGFDKDDFVDADGKPLSPWEQIAGRVWSTEATRQQGAEVGQFAEAELTNFHNTLTALARLVASLTGLPSSYMGYATENPASADALRASLDRLIKRAERKQRAFGGSYERAMRIGERIMTGDWNPDSRRLETIWRDAGTSSRGEAADASVKLFQAGVIPRRTVREDLGYTQTQIQRMEEQDTAEEALPSLNPAAAVKPPAGDTEAPPAPDDQAA